MKSFAKESKTDTGQPVWPIDLKFPLKLAEPENVDFQGVDSLPAARYGDYDRMRIRSH